jgi:hypothetical protein
MLLSMAFTATERERMAVLINNLCFYASQLVIHSSAEISQRALLNLDKIKNEYEPLLKRLDEVAREQGDHSPLRVIEDLVHRPNDVAQMLMLVRRCLLASGFLGHCLVATNPCGFSRGAQSREAPTLDWLNPINEKR